MELYPCALCAYYHSDVNIGRIGCVFLYRSIMRACLVHIAICGQALWAWCTRRTWWRLLYVHRKRICALCITIAMLLVYLFVSYLFLCAMSAREVL